MHCYTTLLKVIPPILVSSNMNFVD